MDQRTFSLVPQASCMFALESYGRFPEEAAQEVPRTRVRPHENLKGRIFAEDASPCLALNKLFVASGHWNDMRNVEADLPRQNIKTLSVVRQRRQGPRAGCRSNRAGRRAIAVSRRPEVACEWNFSVRKDDQQAACRACSQTRPASSGVCVVR